MASYGNYNESPYSSNSNAESASGTPDTRITAFSPDDARLPRTSSIYKKSAGTPLKEGQHDPFVTSQPKVEQKLSATALAFQPNLLVARAAPRPAGPAVVNGSPPVPGTAQYLNQVIADSTPPPRALEPIEALKFGTFTTDTGASRNIKVSGIYGKLVIPAVQDSLQALKKTRSLMGSSRRIEQVGNVVYIRLGSIVDASVIYNKIKMDHLDLAIEYISPGDFGQVVSPSSKHSDYEGQILLCAPYPTLGEANRKDFEESLRALLVVEGPLCAWKRISAPGAEIFQLVAEYADAAMAPRAISRCAENDALKALMANVSLYTPDTSPKRRQAPEATPTRASADHSSVANSLSRLSIHTPQCPQYLSSMSAIPNYDIGATPSSVVIGGRLYSPTPISPLSGLQQQHPSTLNQSPFAIGQGYFNNSLPDPYALPATPPYGFNRNYGPLQNQYHHNLYYNSTHNGPSAHSGHLYSRPSPSRDSREVARRGFSGPHHRRSSQNPASGPHNHVDINKIQAGSDVMLRNIPNKLNQQELKEILDLSSFGRYDFMYLRIDFSNDCNVGYAFVNFADPLDIVPFVRARANQRWHKFKSDKIAEVSYATIQGRDCLIQKFRNSSVMLEPHHYRPKLFFTHSDPLGRVGEEDEFPASDNASKLKRSCENAEHVGLFAPSAGQHMRDEQRRRRSQYDRGTSLAEREDFAYDEGQSGYYGGPYSHHISPRYL